jgi:predicted amidohydrolase
MRAAAIQLEPVIADVAANLESCERLADAAAADGAEVIVLPEFFTTGIAFDERLADAAIAPDGAATDLLRDLALRHGALVGGSFLARDPDGHVRNAFLLADRDGSVLGRHDKDLPTMWENAFYVGGADDGVIDAGDLTTGAAVCWELMRSQTARRLRGRVDVVLAGSGWWSVPEWPPRSVTRRWEAANARTASIVAERFARLVGAPVVHAAHTGGFECRMPGMPVRYRGHLQGGAVIADATGRVVARRDRREGAGFAIADVAFGRTEPLDPVPDRFWLHPRGPMGVWAWHQQRWLGRRWYAEHVEGRPPLAVPDRHLASH